MEFLKKNWVKITLNMLAMVGLILAIINLVDIMRLDGPGFMDKAQYIAFFLFFLGAMIYFVARMFNFNMIASWTILATGLLVTLFFILALVRAGEFNIGNLHMFPLVMQMIALGLMPLVWGINEVIQLRRVTKKSSK